MNSIVEQKTNELDMLFPEGKVVTIPRATGAEELRIMPMPAKKWKQAIKYIAKIAPLLGFDLMGEAVDTEALPANLQNSIWDIINSDDVDILFEFLAYATDKDIDYIGNLYDEIIDVMIAVVEVNLVFFVHKLLPKIRVAMPQAAAIAQNAEKMAKVLIHGQ